MSNSKEVAHFPFGFFHIRASKVVLVHAIKAPDETKILVHSLITWH